MEISVNFCSDEQYSNICIILLILSVFHLEISGKIFKFLHKLNKQDISSTLIVFHLEISGKLFIKEQPQNK